ncbi:TPA: phage tail protein [Proteus mirabilis]
MKNPKLISKPFAQNGQKNVIPEKYETSMESNQATWDQGFGQITMLPVSAGGLPPKGQDFNGILNQISETLVHISKGGVFKFSADYAAAINGYPKGAILQSEDEKKYYQSLIDNNKVNFNTASKDQIKTSWKLVMTDDLLDQLSKKLESSAVAQSTGTSTTSVMSQKASTDAFQPKGAYPTKTEMTLELNKKIDKSSISQQLGNDVNKVPSLDLVTKELGGKQPKGNYISANETKAQSVAGYFLARRRISAFSDDNTQVTLFSLDNGRGGIAISTPTNNYEYFLSGESGYIAFRGESYLKQEADNRFQPKGTYPTTSEMNVELNKKIDKANISQQLANDVNKVPSLDLVTKELSGKQPKGNYQPAGNYALKSDLSNVDNIPVGSPIPWPLPTAPSGYLICNGQTFNKSTYPKLAIAYPSGKLPDLRGEFIRGADSGRGVDTGREVLSSQAGNSLLSARGMGGNSEFSLKMSAGSVGTDNQGQREIYQQIEGQNGNETRPRNIAFLYIVRAA